MDISKSGITLDPSDIPYDITFVIEDCGSKVKAHKLIMAMCSPVCMKQFYGELKEIDGDIVIKDATKDAFITMIDYFYGKKVDWEKKAVEELFEIANMAEKYQVNTLKVKIEGAVQKYLHLDEENFVSVAAVAKNYSQFENLAKTDFMKCQEFLSSILAVYDDYYIEYADKYACSELAVVAFKLLAGMKRVSPKKCCKLKTCRRGKPMLEKSDFVVGERVQFNPEGMDPDVTDVQRRSRVEGVVKQIRLSDYYVTFIELDGDFWYQDGYCMREKNVATFLFCNC